jgi:NAD(P)-dependent dehydrogenase (short-subunit alcohol dehydrogenase family)
MGKRNSGPEKESFANSESRSSTVGSVSWAHKFATNNAQEYQISKAAVNMLNMKYALDHADEGFTFLLISPGVSYQPTLSLASCVHTRVGIRLQQTY